MIKIGGKKIGDNQPCFITFEAGPTHDSEESAKKLATLVAENGGDAIKFQIIDPDRLIADKNQLFSYEILVDRKTGSTKTVSEPLYDILCRRALSHGEWKNVKKHCDELGISFFATIGFEDEIAFLEELNCDSIKIASADVNHWPLIRKAAKTGLCIQLDTGNATIGEIEAAVDVVKSEGNNNIIIHNCPSGYPARIESINLNIISTLKKMFIYPIAFSDHTPGWHMDIAALAKGADLLEKSITENRMTRSVEHIFSLEPADMKQFVDIVREVEIGFGTDRRILHPEELKKRDAIRRSVYLKTAVQKGEKLTSDLVEFRRPGYGIGPDQFESLVGKRFRKDLLPDTILTFEDLV